VDVVKVFSSLRNMRTLGWSGIDIRNLKVISCLQTAHRLYNRPHGFVEIRFKSYERAPLMGENGWLRGWGALK